MKSFLILFILFCTFVPLEIWASDKYQCYLAIRLSFVDDFDVGIPNILDPHLLKEGVIAPKKTDTRVIHFEKSKTETIFSIKDGERKFDFRVSQNGLKKTVVVKEFFNKNELIRGVRYNIDKAQNGFCKIQSKDSINEKDEVFKKLYDFDRCTTFKLKVSRGINSKELWTNYSSLERKKLAKLVAEDEKLIPSLSENTHKLSKAIFDYMNFICPSNIHPYNIKAIENNKSLIKEPKNTRSVNKE